MNHPLHQALNKALLTLMRPLVRILLRNGVTHDAFVDLAKQAYVDVAYREFGIPGRKQTISRVSVLTGLTRKEVSRLLQRENPDEPETRPRYNRAMRVISGWLNDPRFLDTTGEPRELAVDGEENSFSALVKSYSGDIPTKAMLAELLRVHIVEQTSEGLLRLRQHAYIPSNDPVDKIRIFGSHVSELLSTIDHNLDPERDKEPFFQRRVSNDRLPASEVPRFRALAARRSQALLEELDQWLIEHEGENGAPEGEEDPRMSVGLGIFYFENEERER